MAWRKAGTYKEYMASFYLLELLGERQAAAGSGGRLPGSRPPDHQHPRTPPPHRPRPPARCQAAVWYSAIHVMPDDVMPDVVMPDERKPQWTLSGRGTDWCEAVVQSPT
ncbi:hypothetical protein T261_01475 [Streptomyces lydicus]|nr:hypothetical protein T261_01475 [Streptomyces lydicus]